MSRRYYILFCGLNSMKPKMIEDRKLAKSLIAKSKFTNFISLTSQRKAIRCWLQRECQFKLVKSIKKAQTCYKQSHLRYQNFFDSSDNKKHFSLFQAPKNKPFYSNDTIREKFTNLLEQMSSDGRQFAQNFKPLSIESSIYRSKIFPQKTYKAYLSNRGDQKLIKQAQKSCIGYYFTKKQQIFHQRTFFTQLNHIKGCFKGLNYLMIDALLNGIKNIEIYCDNTQFYYLWQYLIHKKVITQRIKQQQTKKEQHTESQKDSQNSNEINNQVDNNSKQVSSSDQQIEQENEINQVNNNSKQVSSSDQQHNKQTQKQSIYYQHLFTPSIPIIDLQHLTQDQQNDFGYQYQQLKYIINYEYKQRRYNQYINLSKFLLTKLQSMKLRWISPNDNSNTIQLINQRLKAQSIKERQYKKKREQFQKYLQQKYPNSKNQWRMSKSQQDETWREQNPQPMKQQ